MMCECVLFCLCYFMFCACVCAYQIVYNYVCYVIVSFIVKCIKNFISTLPHRLCGSRCVQYVFQERVLRSACEDSSKCMHDS